MSATARAKCGAMLFKEFWMKDQAHPTSTPVHAESPKQRLLDRLLPWPTATAVFFAQGAEQPKRRLDRD